VTVTTRIPLTDAITDYFRSLRARGLSPLTIDRYERALRFFSAFCARQEITALDQLRADHLRGYILMRSATVAAITLHHNCTPVKAFSRWCEAEELLPRDPLRSVRKPKQPILTKRM
jgi:site-specific recombinase XerD